MTSPEYSHHFTYRNVPFGIASSARHEQPRPATRLANTVVFLDVLARGGLFDSIPKLSRAVFDQTTLNQFAALGGDVHRAVRKSIQDAVVAGGVNAFPPESREEIDAVTMHLPVSTGDFMDFSCSNEHMKNAGRIVINDPSLPPGALHFPIAYSGRASSIVVSGTDIERPMGQYPARDATRTVALRPTSSMDYEMEFAAVIGKPLPMKQRLHAKDADEHIFGFVVLNDWSSRDIQGFEMRPLGPFNGKSSGTTISPWIVTPDALEPFRKDGPPREIPVPTYLEDPVRPAYAVHMRVEIIAGDAVTVGGTASLDNMYWSARQMVAHSVSAGAGLRTGDILASGTVSGPREDARGCLLETTDGGKTPLKLSDGSVRAQLHDGDVVRMTAVAGGPDSGVGFGECVGKLTPSRPL